MGLRGTICPHEFGDGGADLVGTVFLDEMGSAHSGLGQLGPGPDELADASADERARFGIDEQWGECNQCANGAKAHDAGKVAAVNKQALRVFIAASSVVMGRVGWLIMNGSDAPMSKLNASTVDGAQLVIYPAAGPETYDSLEEPLLAPGESSRMFWPTNVDSRSRTDTVFLP